MGARIFLLDQDLSSLGMLDMLLSEAGYEAFVAQAAMRWLNSSPTKPPTCC